jgi:hypothetical protein
LTEPNAVPLAVHVDAKFDPTGSPVVMTPVARMTDSPA